MKKIYLYHFYIFLIVIISVGCASNPPPKYEVTGIEKSSGVAIQDLRPAKETQSKTFSINIYRKAYGIQRIGSEAIDPKPIRLLEHRIKEKFDDKVEQIKVHHLVSYFNFAASAKKGAWGAALGGVIGSIIASSGADKDHPEVGINYVDRKAFESIDEEYKLGTYTKEENPNKSNVVITYLDVEINEKRVFIRRIAPAIPNEEINVYLAELDKAYDSLLNEFK